jgi:uncharacterized protein
MLNKLRKLLIPTLFLLAPNVFSQELEKSLFWEISGNGLKKPSYLYGTMHTADERVFNFSDDVLEAFKKCKVYAMELDPGKAVTADLLQKLIMDSSYTIQSLLSEEDFQLVKTFFKDSLKQNLLMYNKMQPMFVSSIMSQRNLQNNRSEALDLYFHKLALEQKKQVEGLEHLDEQINAFKSIPYQKQAEGLVDAVKNSAKEAEEMAVLLQYYVSGDLDKLLEFTLKEDISENFSEVFLVNRNKNMADRAIPLIKKQQVFIAVGAAHLPGEDGVINLLRQKGYKVTAK